MQTLSVNLVPSANQGLRAPTQPSTIPFVDCDGTGTPLVFLHANGFPPACYQPLLHLMSGFYRTRAMCLRPLWPQARPEELTDWHALSHDLLRFLDEHDLARVIAVGHSMGAIAALRAAVWEPQRFSALVLLEPVLLPRRIMLVWRLVRALGLGYRLHPLIPGALRRQREFSDLESAYARYRPRHIFRYFSDGGLRAYISGILVPTAGGSLGLAYSPEWEARLYDVGVWNDWDLWPSMQDVAMPTLVVRGAESDTLHESETRAIQRLNAQIRISVMGQSTHLLPMERPEETFAIIRSFLEGAALRQSSSVAG